MLTKNEKACPICGTEIGYEKRTVGGELLSGLGRIVFYISIAALLHLSFSNGPGFVIGLFVCTGALMFLMRKKKR